MCGGKARLRTPAVPYDEDEDEAAQEQDDDTNSLTAEGGAGGGSIAVEGGQKLRKKSKNALKRARRNARAGLGGDQAAGGSGADWASYRARSRQTLLYSATAIATLAQQDKLQQHRRGAAAAQKKAKKLKGVAGAAAVTLPLHLQQ